MFCGFWYVAFAAIELVFTEESTNKIKPY